MSNEGEIDRQPIHKLTERLQTAVTTGQVFFNVRFIPGEAAKEKILVTEMFALGGFDFLCHPSIMYVEDPKFETIKLICNLVNQEKDKAEIVGLSDIAKRVS